MKPLKSINEEPWIPVGKGKGFPKNAGGKEDACYLTVDFWKPDKLPNSMAHIYPRVIAHVYYCHVLKQWYFINSSEQIPKQLIPTAFMLMSQEPVPYDGREIIAERKGK